MPCVYLMHGDNGAKLSSRGTLPNWSSGESPSWGQMVSRRDVTLP